MYGGDPIVASSRVSCGPLPELATFIHGALASGGSVATSLALGRGSGSAARIGVSAIGVASDGGGGSVASSPTATTAATAGGVAIATIIGPVRVRGLGALSTTILAMPKSSSLGSKRPARSMTMMFDGLRSRWTMPPSCAVCTTSATRSKNGTSWAIGSGPRSRSQRSSVVPWTSSIAIQHRPSSFSTPKA